MPERRGTRFIVEVLFLAALATALGFARLHAIEIIGAMALGWAVVAAIEWAAWRGEPHYGSGLPPRYHVPVVSLPPPQPLEQVERGYPESARDEAPTWIASAALRAEVLGEWPHAAPLPVEADEEDEADEEPEFVPAAEVDADPWTVAELPAEPLDDADEVVVLPPPVEVPVRRPVAVGVAGGQKALYRFDPLGDVTPKRRFRRGQADAGETLEVDARPSGPRALPSSLR